MIFILKKQNGFDFSSSYSITSGKLDKAVNGNKNLPYIPSGKTVGALKLSLKKIAFFKEPYLSIVVSNYGMQRNVSEYELSSEGYTLLDAHIGSDFKLGKQKILFDIFCTNLLNKGYFNQLSLVKYIGVRDMGRNVGIQLHIPLGIKG